jgi:hypothetical protein
VLYYYYYEEQAQCSYFLVRLSTSSTRNLVE